MGKIGPKEAAMRERREQIAKTGKPTKGDLNIPDFLKRTETPEQAAKRDAKHAKKPVDPKLKVIEPYNPNDPIRKAIAKDLKDDTPAGVAQTINAALPKIETPKPAKTKKLSPLLAKAVAEKEKLNQPKQSATAEPMESGVKKTKKAAKTNGAGGERKTYDWTGAKERAEKGSLPPTPDFSANTHKYYRPLLAEAVKFAKAGNVKALLAMKFARNDGSPGVVKRYRDIAVAALKAAK